MKTLNNKKHLQELIEKAKTETRMFYTEYLYSGKDN